MRKTNVRGHTRMTKNGAVNVKPHQRNVYVLSGEYTRTSYYDEANKPDIKALRRDWDETATLKKVNKPTRLQRFRAGVN